jgi:hypothetical protein
MHMPGIVHIRGEAVDLGRSVRNLQVMTNALSSWTARSALLAGDISEGAIRSMVRTGELYRIRRGRYANGDHWEASDDHERHRIRALEIGASLEGRAAISHESAALLHGMQLTPGLLPRVHVTWPASPGRRTTTNITPHRGRVPAQQLQVLDGVLITNPGRTVFDIGCSAPLPRAIAAADSALRLGLCSPDDLVKVLAHARQIRGIVRARAILEFADAGAESVGESVCRLRMAQLGLPTPTVQSVIPELAPKYGTRVDFEFEDQRTVAEFDGRVKYGRLLEPGQHPGDVVFAEKVREDRIRDTGRECVRVIWADFDQGFALLDRFRAAFRRAGFPNWVPAPPRFRTINRQRADVRSVGRV